MIRVISLLMVSLGLYAQQTVSGTVTDASGAPVAKAKLALTHTGSADVHAVTGNDGSFVFTGVADGSYKLRAEAKKLGPIEKKLKVSGSPVTLSIQLEVASQTDSVTVAATSSKVAEQAVSADRNADRLNFEEEFLDAIPASGGNALSVVAGFLSPSAQGGEGVNITVDGVETSASAMPASAIRRIRVNRNPYALQFRRPGKARLEVYGQEGSLKRWRGAFGVSARNSIFDARNAFASTRPSLSRTLMDFNLSGPITRQKSSFYINAEHFRNNENAVVNARTLAGPLVENVPVPERRTRLLGRYESQGEIHQIQLQYSLLRQGEENRGAGGLKLAEQGAPSSERTHRTQFSDRALLFGKLLNDFRFVAQREETERGVATSQPAIVVQGAFTGGATQTYRLRSENSVRVQNYASLALGRHTLRFGVEVRPAFFDSVERSNFGGTYEFAGLDTFGTRQALQYRVTQGDPAVDAAQHETAGFIQDEFLLAKGLQLTYGVRYGWQSDVSDTNNFAPRVGFAYSPGKSKFVVRGGAGVFHERITEDVRRRTLLFDGVRLRESIFQNVSYPLSAGVSGQLPAPSVTRAYDLVSPVLTMASLGVEREIWKRNTLAIEYQSLRGRHLLRSRNGNAPINGIRPDATILQLRQVESSASMNSDGMTVTWRGGAGKWLTTMAQYALSKTNDDTGGAFELTANAYDARPEWGRSGYDQRHRVNATAMVELPLGFRIGSFAALASGAPYNVTTGRDNNGDTVVNDRPAGVGRNTGQGPGLVRVDLRLTKLFQAPRFLDRGKAHTSRNVEFSIDAFNLFNHTNFESYVGVLTSPFFGSANAALAPRTIQIS
jgi:hypothetical protein